MTTAAEAIQQKVNEANDKIADLTDGINRGLESLNAKLQVTYTEQKKLKWTPPSLLRSLQAAIDSSALIGATVKFKASLGAGTRPRAGQKTDALTLGIGLSAKAQAKIALGLSIGVGFSASAAIGLKLAASLKAALSKTNDVNRYLLAFNAAARLKAGAKGTLAPGIKLDLGPVNKSLRALNDELSTCQRHADAASQGQRLDPITAELRQPRVGAWFCDIEADAIAKTTGKVRFKLDDLEFVATVLDANSGTDGNRSKIRVVAGNGNLTKTVSRSYSASTGVKVSVVVRDILKDCGEHLSDLSDADTLDVSLARWHIPESTAQTALTRLAEQTGASWRVLRDGTVWFGTETWPEVEPSGEITQQNWQEGHVELASETPDMVPGTVFQGQKIEQVTHRYGVSLRTEIRTSSAGSAFAGLFKSRQHEIDYSREYPCKVVTQHADGTLQLLPDDAVMRSAGLDHVPIRYGIPGLKATIASGARCHLSFAAGDPSRPFVGSWEYDPEKVVLNSILDGAQSLARVGDLITAGGPGLICTLMPVTLVGAPPNNAIAAGMPCMISFSALPATTPAQQVPLYGAISTGIPKFQG
jgi:hypothetical protein